MTDFEVAIVGAGPVGLWLAGELRLAGVSVVVLEARTERDPNSKALTIHPRTIEVLASRGLAERFLKEGRTIPRGHFGMLESWLDFELLDTQYPFTLVLPQARTEELLEERARAAGADIRRGQRVSGLHQNEDEVTVHFEEQPDLTARWVVGCDGVRSVVREASGIGYPGTPSTVLGWLADVELAAPPEVPAFSRWDQAGLMLVAPIPGGHHRLVGFGPEDLRTDWPGELSLDEVRTRTRTVTGTDWGIHSPIWLSRFGNASRQADRYRQGRVLIAGDAAHQHFPAGGVGMNVGIQDAMNLGWKLAATVHGWAPEGLLDSYHTERHPVGAALLRSTQAQTAVMSAFSPEGAQLRALLSELIATRPGFAHPLAEQLSGLAVAYPAAPDAHPLTGTRAPDFELPDGSTLFAALCGGTHVLLDFTDRVSACRAAGVTRLLPISDRPDWTGVAAALVRPDGYLAWVGDDTTGLPAALRAAGLPH
ncbi:FAD-dependent monooxygenase [Nocardia crassostreae]|uniref:FAD-dependent monooxygenase n=1 Tax=Nocardia crassostreae TaxID=53428 RepID=UPI000834E607|nr:FAD-dependent monooxygenase [Nocardia crassostreae]